MLFLRSICLVAATAYVAFTSAYPAQKPSVDVIQPLDTDVRHAAAQVLDAGVTTDGGVDVVIGFKTNIRRHDIEYLAEVSRTLQPLPDILSSAVDELMNIQAEAESLGQNEKKLIPLVDIHNYLGNVNAILVGVVANVKLLEGQPLNVVLGPCTVTNLAILLSTVLTLVVKILLGLLACSGPNHHTVIDIIVSTISVVLCELLTLVFGLVSGILGLLLPLLGGILGLLIGCGLGGVLNVLSL